MSLTRVSFSKTEFRLRKTGQIKKNLISLFASVMVHLVLAILFLDVKVPTLSIPVQKLDPAQLAKTRIQLDEIKFLPPEEIRKLKDKTQRKNRQIVSTEDRGESVKPVASRFLGEKDQQFLRETIAKRNGSFKEMGLGSKTGSETANSLEKPKSDIAKQDQPAGRLKNKNINWGDLAIGMKSHSLENAKEVAHIKTQAAVESDKNGALGDEAGKASKVGLSANNDFVEEIPLGDFTQLNTQEFKYFGFYNRIKLQLEQFWGKSINEKARALYRSGRRMPASDNMITSVTVVLNELGQIVSIKIDGSSGVRELDHAAVESFKKAGPFPNPPKGLVVDGRAIIQWGFVVRS